MEGERRKLGEGEKEREEGKEKETPQTKIRR